jgi:hypothetical protein
LCYGLKFIGLDDYLGEALDRLVRNVSIGGGFIVEP